jgi:hypothetical protein
MMDKADRREIEARLSEICETHDGRITPELTVEDAKDPGSPLHPIFEWDDGKAGHQFRLDQARQLLRSIRVVIRRDDRKIVVPYYVRDPDAGDEQGYVSFAAVKSEHDKAVEVASHEFKMAAAAMVRARAIADGLGIESEVDDVIERIGRVKKKVKAG